MQGSLFEESLLDEQLICSEVTNTDRCMDLESGFIRTVFQDQQGIEHLRVYAPMKDIPEELWEVFRPKGEMAPLELLSPE